MKNHSGEMIFQSVICAGASQITLIADEEQLARFSSPRRVNRSGMEDDYVLSKLWNKK